VKKPHVIMSPEAYGAPRRQAGLPVAKVTDHAVVRWLERVKGIDLDPIRRAMRKQGLGDKHDRWVIQFIEKNSDFDFGIIRSEIQQIIAIPALSGASSVRYGDVVIRLIDGIAVSVVPLRSSDLPDTSRRKRSHDLRRPRKLTKTKRDEWREDDEEDRNSRKGLQSFKRRQTRTRLQCGDGEA
jgi:hypothetical protein